MIKGVASIKNFISGDVLFDLSQLSDFLERFGVLLVVILLLLIVFALFIFSRAEQFVYFIFNLLFKLLYLLIDRLFSTIQKISFNKNRRFQGYREDPSLLEQIDDDIALQEKMKDTDKKLALSPTDVMGSKFHPIQAFFNYIIKRRASSDNSQEEDEP